MSGSSGYESSSNGRTNTRAEGSSTSFYVSWITARLRQITARIRMIVHSEHEPRFEQEPPRVGRGVLAHWLRRRLSNFRTEGKKLGEIQFFDYDPSVAEAFLQTAERAPAAFVRHVLPVVLKISDSALIENTPPRRDAVWRMLIRTDHPSSRDACLMGATGALATLAEAMQICVM